MTCDFYISLINGHLDGINTVAEEAQLQEHLKTCENCRSLLSVLQENDALLHASRVDPPADLTAHIMQKVRNNPKRKSKKVFYTSLAATGLAAAAALAIFLSGNVQPPDPQGVAVAAEVEPVSYVETEHKTYADSSKRSIGSVGVLVLHGNSEEIDFEGEPLDMTSLSATVRRAGYTVTGEETSAYSVSWSEIKRIHEEYGDQFNAAFYNPNANSNGIIVFVD